MSERDERKGFEDGKAEREQLRAAVTTEQQATDVKRSSQRSVKC